MGFYDRYIETVTKNDERTRSSVDSIMGRMDKLLNDPDEECHATGRISGLVVGRVQSGKTRNYVGLALKAADAGWNVIIVLTSAITALAKQTEDRIMLDFENSDVLPNMANRLNLLDDAFNGNAKILEKPCPFFFWGVAMKERASLARIKKWMDDNKRYAPHMRVLLIDDEADNATPNSNAGKDVVAEDPKDIVEDVATTMRECRADNYDDLADWLEGLLEYNPPDEAANTAEAKTYKALRECVAGAGSAKSKKTKILGNSAFIALLGLDQTAADFIATIEKSPKYFGLDEIYGRNLKDAKARMDIIRAIPDDEESSTDEKDMIIDPLVNTSGGTSSKTSNAHKVRVKEDLTCIFDGHRTIVWQSLKDAIAWSFCCAAARRWHRLTIDVPAMKAEITDAKRRRKKKK